MKVEARSVALRLGRDKGRGVVLLALLLGLALCGIALMTVVDVAALARQREREKELMFAGDQIRRAIEHYYYAAPRGYARVLPTSLQDLLEDQRFQVPVRHLRRIYPDPMTGGTQWQLLRLGSGIVGVRSNADTAPIKRAFFPPAYVGFEGKTSYADWAFVFIPPGGNMRLMKITER